MVRAAAGQDCGLIVEDITFVFEANYRGVEVDGGAQVADIIDDVGQFGYPFATIRSRTRLSSSSDSPTFQPA